MNSYFEVIIVANGFIVRPVSGQNPGYCGASGATHVFASATEVGKFLREQEKAIKKAEQEKARKKAVAK